MKFLLTLILVTFLRAGVGSQLQACGSALTDILSLVCRNQFHEPMKRNHSPEGDNPPVRYRERRTSPVKQKRGGVVEECCFSSCSYENLLLYCSQSVEPIDIFTAARSETTTTVRPSTTRRTTTTSSSTAAAGQTTDKPPAEMDDKSAAAAWALSRRWFYVNRLGRFRGQGGRRIINM